MPVSLAVGLLATGRAAVLGFGATGVEDHPALAAAAPIAATPVAVSAVVCFQQCSIAQTRRHVVDTSVCVSALRQNLRVSKQTLFMLVAVPAAIGRNHFFQVPIRLCV